MPLKPAEVLFRWKKCVTMTMEIVCISLIERGSRKGERGKNLPSLQQVQEFFPLIKKKNKMRVPGGDGRKRGSPWCPINLVAVDKTPQSQHSLALESLRHFWLAEQRGAQLLLAGDPALEHPSISVPEGCTAPGEALSLRRAGMMPAVARWMSSGAGLSPGGMGMFYSSELHQLVVKGLKWVTFACGFGWDEALLALLNSSVIK